MEKVDFESVKLIDIGIVLSHYGVEVRQQGEFLVARNCPLPTHKNQKDTGTFKANIPGNWWTCFSDSCKKGLGKSGGDVIDFVCIMESIKPLSAAKKLAELFSPGAARQPDEARPGAADSHANKPLSWSLQRVNPVHPIIQSRGISRETAEKWGVGYYRSKQGTASMDDRIVFPLREDGELIGYAGRTVLPVTEENPKWKLGKGVRKSFLYGLDKCDPEKPVIVVESPWAVLWFDERGHQAASLLGSEMTAEQEERLEPYPTLIIAFDNDQKGREAAAKVFGRLRGKHKVIRGVLQE